MPTTSYPYPLEIVFRTNHLTFNKSSREHGQTQKWCENIIFSEVVDGKHAPIYQVYLTLSNETALVEQVAQVVEEEVGTRVMLLENKGLRIIPLKQSTKGKSKLDMIVSISSFIIGESVLKV